MSDPVSLTCGVLQGSVIGPQKLVAYTEDIAETNEAFMVNHRLYADDTQLQTTCVLKLSKPIVEKWNSVLPRSRTGARLEDCN